MRKLLLSQENNVDSKERLRSRRNRIDRILETRTNRKQYSTPQVPQVLPQFPNEILIHIFRYLTMKDRLYFSLACVHFNDLFNCCVGWVNITISGENAKHLNFMKHLGKCSELRSLHLYQLESHDSSTLNQILSSLPVSSPQLRSLKIHSPAFPMEKETLHLLLEETLPGCRGISHLSLSDCRLLCDNHVETILNCVKNLRHLHLYRSGVTNKTLELIAGYCPHIISLSLPHSNLSEEGFRSLVENCRELTVLDVTGCYLTDTAISYLTPANKKLKRLFLGNNDITDLGIEMLVNNCPELVELNLNSCRRLTDSSFSLLSLACSHLTTLKIFDTIVTDTGIKDISLNCLLLEDLNLFSCSRLTDQSLRDLAVNGKSLRTLVVLECELITASGRYYLLEHSTTLQELDYHTVEVWRETYGPEFG